MSATPNSLIWQFFSHFWVWGFNKIGWSSYVWTRGLCFKQQLCFCVNFIFQVRRICQVFSRQFCWLNSENYENWFSVPGGSLKVKKKKPAQMKPKAKKRRGSLVWISNFYTLSLKLFLNKNCHYEWMNVFEQITIKN